MLNHVLLGLKQGPATMQNLSLQSFKVKVIYHFNL